MSHITHQPDHCRIRLNRDLEPWDGSKANRGP
jgi:hypothetical protein